MAEESAPTKHVLASKTNLVALGALLLVHYVPEVKDFACAWPEDWQAIITVVTILARSLWSNLRWRRCSGR